ncbi:F0F1 ATP synthase subunit B [Paraburkholderia kururiensis]|uniref:ATP synthase subunit b n=1 Tax=Paraburkholderia kururiensis TaxID=984307 RepID=A0ABZ0WN20_9BURK|nr:F0F1 ATP synthase subunit B [Paraburkholderia kururiensis]WQD78774.1 F0F1 ATP synthase subunit B [Paraburkholderia kururiensis]
MRIDWTTLALQTVNAVILVWLLARFLFRPVADIIAQRQKAAQALIDDANAAKHDAEAERDAAREATAQLAQTRTQALQAIDAEVAAQKTALLAAAHADADRLRADAEADMARARVVQENASAGRAAQLAVDIASRLLNRLPASARVEGFIGGIVDGVKALPEPIRAELGARGAPLDITAPRALSIDEQHACEAALSAALGCPVAIAVHEDPALIAGLELTAPHATVRNSFRHDLTSIMTTLQSAHDENAS